MVFVRFFYSIEMYTCEVSLLLLAVRTETIIRWGATTKLVVVELLFATASIHLIAIYDRF